ncbi:MAG: hypothetical protein FWE86_04125, partial [Oscillospiraceae bacterium]|nr:hypothetical protein [Oscillospiraceae bacterium]
WEDFNVPMPHIGDLTGLTTIPLSALPTSESSKVPAGYTFYYIGMGKTDSDSGIIRFDDCEWINRDHVENGNFYMVMETAAPPGYVLPDYPDNMTVVDVFTPTGTDYVTIYNTPDKAKATIFGRKDVSGGNLTEYAEFIYNLIQVEDENGDDVALIPYDYNGIPGYRRNEKTASTNGPGNFKFDLDELGPGTTYYMITEAPDGDGDPDWDYDETTYIVRITVDVDSVGYLVVSMTYKTLIDIIDDEKVWSAWENLSGSFDGPITFNNTYHGEPDAVHVEFAAKKRTVNGPMDEGMFGFELYEMTGDPFYDFAIGGLVETAHNYTSGYESPVYFDWIALELPPPPYTSVYYYFMTEAAGPENWIMDGRNYLFKVQVYDLSATVWFTEADKFGNPLDEFGRPLLPGEWDPDDPDGWTPYDKDDPPEFVNLLGGPILPYAGGLGTSAFTKYGLMLITGAMLIMLTASAFSCSDKTRAKIRRWWRSRTPRRAL